MMNRGGAMDIGRLLRTHLGWVPAPITRNTRETYSRVRGAHVFTSISPYCAGGCSQLVHTRGGRLVDVEGDAASPVDAGALRPKGAAWRGPLYRSAMVAAGQDPADAPRATFELAAEPPR
jgi:anaerobic selenocysteine-containing dehydrogenase